MSLEEIDLALDQWITDHADEIVQSVQGLVRIPSVLGEPADGAPYGVETRAALDYVEALTGRYGLRTKMLDGHAMHAEFGDGDYLIGILSHVDVVPEGQDWTYPAFAATIDNGKIFGRGVIDDKGPAVASLYAMFAVKQTGVNIPHSRVRAIIGADEESGFRCVDHYFKQEQMPDVGFTPDGSFPAIFAEKGIASPVLQAAIPFTYDDVKLVAIGGGERSNMVPDRAWARLAGACPDWASLAAKLTGGSVSAAVDCDGVLVTAVGVSAHASYPHKGVNAVAILTRALMDSGIVGGAESLLSVLNRLAADISGEIIGIAGSDAVSGNLTSNLGVLTTGYGSVSATFSVRYPVTWKGDDIKQRVTDVASRLSFQLVGWADSKPLYVPENDPLLATLLSVYRAQTGDMSAPKTMGGGTYARVLKKGVAFGPDFPGGPDVAHKADEYWTIDELILSTRIYAKAIARLAIQAGGSV